MNDTTNKTRNNNNNISNGEQPRRKLSVPSISSIHINQTLSECEVVVEKRASSVNGITSYTSCIRQSSNNSGSGVRNSEKSTTLSSLSSVRRVTRSPSTERSLNSSPRKRALSQQKTQISSPVQKVCIIVVIDEPIK